IDNAHMNLKLRITIPQFVAQFVQSVLASRDEHDRSRACCELPCKLAADSRRSASDQSGAAINFHSFGFTSNANGIPPIIPPMWPAMLMSGRNEIAKPASNTIQSHIRNRGLSFFR